MTAQRKYEEHYTLSEWESWKDRWELIDGMPYCMSPMPSFRHQDINGKMDSAVLEEIRKNRCPFCKVVLPIDWEISDDTVVQPDLLIICRPFEGGRLIHAPFAVFEILSPSTRQKDKTVKYDLYQSQGVQHYTMVDPETESLESFSLNEKGRYELTGTGPVLSLQIENCRISIDFSSIWEEARS